MVTTLDVIASFLGWTALFMAVWAVIPREPRLMTAALGLAALSMVYASGAAAYQHHYETVATGGAGVVLVAVLVWRTWPPGLHPWRQFWAAAVPAWRQFRRVVSPNRIAENKEP